MTEGFKGGRPRGNNMNGGRLAILLPHQIALVRAEVEEELASDIEFEKGCGYVSWNRYDHPREGVSSSVWWDALSFLAQEGECWVDEDMVEADYDDNGHLIGVSVWVTTA